MTQIHSDETRESLVKILKELQLDTMAVQVDIGDYDNEVEYLTAKLHWAEVQLEALLAKEQTRLLDGVLSELPKYRDNTDTEGHLPVYDDHISVGYNQALTKITATIQNLKETL